MLYNLPGLYQSIGCLHWNTFAANKLAASHTLLPTSSTKSLGRPLPIYADFAFIYPFFVTAEINKLEKKFLELIQYNVTVTSKLYAKYYFELRALFKDSETEFPLVPLDKR